MRADAAGALAELRVGTAAPARVAAPEEGPLLLVVEDNLELNRFICESVAPELRSASAYNGAEGLRAARDLHPDLILTDVMMPVMSGDALIALLRSDPDLQTIPIVVLTAKADDGLRIRLLNAGARDCLTKPFSVEELRARLFNIANAKLGADRLMAANAGLQQAKAKAEAWLAAYERSEKVCARYQRGRVAANAAGGERLRLRRLLSVRAERGRARRRLVRCVAVARRPDRDFDGRRRRQRSGCGDHHGGAPASNSRCGVRSAGPGDDRRGCRRGRCAPNIRIRMRRRSPVSSIRSR
jgi:CheY-like chemotaxis protein